jgi:DNA-binding response OmpR family regulator
MPEGMRKVMVVEDTEDYAFLLSRALNHSRRFQIVWHARDGQDAISYLAGTGQFHDRKLYPLPEAVLLDIQLPRKSGFEVLEWITQQDEKPKVVMLSVLEHHPTHQKALQAGADEFKEKPYDDERLKEFVRWLDEWIGHFLPATAAAPPAQTRSQKPASQGKLQRQGSARDECERGRNRRLER